MQVPVRPLLVLLVLLAPSLAGCAAFQDLLDDVRRPDIPVSRTPLVEGDWNRETRFLVFVQQPGGAEVRIEATSAGGEVRESVGVSTADDPVFVDLGDGTWTVTYHVAGHKWETFRDVRIDGTPPEPVGLERVGDAQDGAYTVGVGATVPSDARVELVDRDGRLLATALPHTVTGLASGLHSYTLTLTDEAGNRWSGTVQVRAGDAVTLPEEGAYSFGIVARYTNEVRVWDLSDLDAYLSPDDARTRAAALDGGPWMGAGYGIDPDDAAVRQVVQETLLPSDDTTAEIAYRLFEWMYDNLEYDETRLQSNTLMLPHQVIGDTEHPDDRDGDADGLVDDGSGNGVRGGVCRDLAATYVSLLRAAGVPARLVSGYLAGEVDGFHAWVEFYGGDLPGNPGPWVPVDVSPIDGAWGEEGSNGAARGPSSAMQSFGIRLPEYLALRAVPSEGEVAGWSTALSAHYQYGAGDQPPSLSFEKAVQVQGQEDVGVLCFDLETRQRVVASAPRDCGQMWYVKDFVRLTERIIDYGVHIDDARRGTSFDAQIAFPFSESVQPDAVDFVPYTNPVEGKEFGFEWDRAAGKLVAEFTV